MSYHADYYEQPVLGVPYFVKSHTGTTIQVNGFGELIVKVVV